MKFISIFRGNCVSTCVPGMNGDLAICPDTGYVVVVLANLDPMAASRISEFIINRLPEGTR
jgi:hypothetical protein